jgi:CDP-paratose 2-epimerase
MKKALVTGSCGLIGSESVRFLIEKGYIVHGIDNDMRQYFFGVESSTNSVKEELELFDSYVHYNIDIRDNESIENIFLKESFDIIIHTAAQPSHDWASREPYTDFTINANGTLILLENFRKHSPKASFIFTSTNKVYGDTPNKLDIREMDTRYEYVMDYGELGSVDESMSIDNTKHSIFGASKVSADIMVQEYGKYFNLNTVCFRGGCLTGPNHKGAELHGFLSYLIKCIVNNKDYTIYGYKGKQVRDNIHSRDLVDMFWEFHLNPKQGVVYNAGGGRENSVSILEVIDYVNKKLNMDWNKFTVKDEPRIGDHIWYITDLNKFKKDYPKWSIKISVFDIIDEIIEGNLNTIDTNEKSFNNGY